MMNMQNIACTATFMAFGMYEVDTKYRKRDPDGINTYDIYTVWDKGGIELHLELAQYAEISEKLVEFITQQCEFDFPGVYDYEVSEPFGAWFTEYLFEHGDTPSKFNAVEKLIELAVEFFTQCGQPDEMPPKLLTLKLREVTL